MRGTVSSQPSKGRSDVKSIGSGYPRPVDRQMRISRGLAAPRRSELRRGDASVCRAVPLPFSRVKQFTRSAVA
jgi:hypothetical protein